MTLHRLLLVHAVVTLAAGVVLIGAPAVIPASVGIILPPDAYLIGYLLGASEVSLACLSYYGTRLTDAQSLRVICLTFIVFHSLTAAVEVYAYTQGTSGLIGVNVAVRLVVIGLFWYYGLIKQKN